MIRFEVVTLLLDSNYPSGVRLMLISDVKGYLYIPPTHNLLPHIQIDTMGYQKVGTNDNLIHNIVNNIDMAYADVAYPHLHLCFSVDDGRLSSSCPESHIAKSFTTSGLIIDCVVPMSIVRVCCLLFI